MAVSIRAAKTVSERQQVARLHQAAFEPDGSMLTGIARRLVSSRRARADWWILEEEDAVLAALLCYPLVFGCKDENALGFGLGSVATHPKHRRNGYATRLCEVVIERSVREGRGVGLLFSSIGNVLYERMGFRVTEPFGFRCDRVGELAQGKNLRIVPLEPRIQLDWLADTYNAWHPGLYLMRDPERLEHSLLDNPTHLFFRAGKGYARIAMHPDTVEILELVVPPDQTVRALRALAGMADAMGRKTVSGWIDVPPELQVLGLFEPVARDTTLPMVYGWHPLDKAVFHASDYF
jgi:predicted N-acetyltransferase YhbS